MNTQLIVRNYRAAAAAYNNYWAHVDAELYDIVQRANAATQRDEYAKVVFVERVYSAGIRRRAGIVNAEWTIAGALADRQTQALIQRGLAALRAAPNHSAKFAHSIDLQQSLVAQIARLTGSRLLDSFCSKYLHFHDPGVPIYDDNANRSLGGRGTYPGYQVTPLESQPQRVLLQGVGINPNWRLNYPKYVERFAAFFSVVVARHPHAAVKEIDYQLWN